MSASRFVATQPAGKMPALPAYDSRFYLVLRQRIISPEHLSKRARCIRRNSPALRMLASEGLNLESGKPALVSIWLRLGFLLIQDYWINETY